MGKKKRGEVELEGRHGEEEMGQKRRWQGRGEDKGGGKEGKGKRVERKRKREESRR